MVSTDSPMLMPPATITDLTNSMKVDSSPQVSRVHSTMEYVALDQNRPWYLGNGYVSIKLVDLSSNDNRACVGIPQFSFRQVDSFLHNIFVQQYNRLL